MPLTILFALLLALMLNRAHARRRLFQNVYFFPNLTSMVAVGCVAMLLFQPDKGPVNQLLLALGVPQDSLPQWFFSTKTALYTVILVVVWKQAGYYMIMFMGGLKNIPPHLYEAAKIDGANGWKLFWHVTWPMLSPTTFMVTILCFNQFVPNLRYYQCNHRRRPRAGDDGAGVPDLQRSLDNWKDGVCIGPSPISCL